MFRILFLAALVFAIVSLVSCEKKPSVSSVELKYNCVMNGYGTGYCTFTNTESRGTGARCGSIKVLRRDGQKSVTSEVFCSGQVEPSSTKKVDFSIPAVNDLCDAPEGKWSLVCAFDFIPQ